jgi:subtilisin family serine protease
MLSRAIFIFFFLQCVYAWAQTNHEKKFWIFFKDKPAIYQHLDPHQYLSDKSIKRRARNCIAIHTSDWPLDNNYLQIIRDYGIKIKHISKWFNAVSVYTNEEAIAKAKKLSFVESIEPVAVFKNTVSCTSNTKYPILSTQDTLQNSYNQLHMLGLDILHANNLIGKDITIAVMDGGFTDVDKLRVYKPLFEQQRLLGVRNFVDSSANPFRLGGGGEHGSRVLSILAAYQPANYFGSAYGANFLLAVTEDNQAEGIKEEDNWLAAMEWADSAGADITSTSLGYFNGFTYGTSYTYQDMDGKTTRISKAANLAAAKGILVVNSAGNEGDKDWKYIIAPADADSVLSIGGVDANKNYAAFSSIGPTSDGRLKPNVCARAYATTQIGSDGRVIYGYGTSFSCPLISGLAACLLQADTNLGNMQLFQIIQRSADRYFQPDMKYGYGIPNAAYAYELLTGKKLLNPATSVGGVSLFPNPCQQACFFAIDNLIEASSVLIELYNYSGFVVYSQKQALQSRYNQFVLDFSVTNIDNGMYYLKYTTDNGATGWKKLALENR